MSGRLRRRWLVTAMVAATFPGLVVLAAIAQRLLDRHFVGHPPALAAPATVPRIPSAASAHDGTLAVPADWRSPLPASARRTVGQLPKPAHELVGSRDAVTEVWQNTDGTRTVTIHSEPVHFQRPGSTAWENIDNHLVPDPDRAGWVRNAANAWTVRFGPITAGGNGGVELATGTGVIRFAPELDAGTSPVDPVVGSSNTVAYPNVWPGVSVLYTVSSDRVKEELIVRRAGRAEFPFVVDGLGLTQAGASSVHVGGGQSGKVGLLDPTVLDGDGQIVDGQAAPTMAVAGAATTGRQRLVVGVDHKWLADQVADGGRVVVDPTVVISNSYHSSYKSDGTVFNQDGIRVGNSLGGGGGADSYWRSAAAFPYWDQIVGKQLLYAGVWLNRNDGTASGQPVSAWYACGSDFASAVCGGDTTRRYATVAGVTDFVALDVTQLVGGWQFLGVQGGVFGFSGAETPGAYTYKKFAAPSLVLNVNTPPPAPTLVAPANNSLAITSLTPTLTWNPVTDPDGDAMTYTAKIATGADGESGLVATSPAGSATSWQVPAGVLKDGVTYYWKVFASDGNAWKASAVRRITVDQRLGDGAESPTDQVDGVSVNLVTGNASLSAPGIHLPTVGGGIGVDFTYNSLSTPDGLIGEYRVDTNQNRTIDASDPLALVRTDPQVSFNWTVPASDSVGDEATSPSPGVPPEWYTVRWRGFVALPTGQWQLGARSDDGVRVYVDGSLVLDKWVTRSLPVAPDYQTGSVAGGSVHQIKVEYFQATSGAAVELWARNASDPTQASVVPAAWLSSQPNILPQGWSLRATDTGAAYTRADVSDGSVTLFAPDGSTTSYAKTAYGLGYAPPPGVQDVLVVNADGTITVQADDGRTYLFRPDGGLNRVVGAVDDQNPAAANATYDTAGRLTTLTDPVSARAVRLTYAPDATCPSQPPVIGGDSFGPPPDGMLCKVDYWDGTSTQLYYRNGLLGYVRNPGDAYWGFSYDSTGHVVGYHNPLTFDAAMSVRSDWDQLLTQISYDGAGRVASVTQPPPNQGDPRPAHSYAYAPTFSANAELTGGTTAVTRSGQSTPYRTVTYDGRGRGTAETNAAGQTVNIGWNANDEMATVQDPAGLKTSTTFDVIGRATDDWGPAPSTMYNNDGSGQSGVPHSTTGYDEGLDGLAVHWWPNANLTGTPVLHTYNAGSLNSDWGSGSPGPGVPADNFSARFTGYLVFPAAGTYTLRIVRDNKAAVFLNDVVALYKWDNTTSTGDDFNVTVTAATTTRRLRVDYADTGGPAKLQMQWKTPGSSSFVTVPGSALKTGYDLTTSTVDPTGMTSTASYTDAATGIGPQHGVAVRETTDPTGANLSSSMTYESVGTGFVRDVSSTPPAGAASASTTTYYGSSETRDNPCTTANDPVSQGGLVKLDTAADPDGSGPQMGVTHETVYDASGRPVAIRTGSDPWTCTTYDARGRVLTISYPPFGGQPSRTVTYSYLTDPDGSGSRPASPLVTSVTDLAGTVMSETDLLGRPIAYQDVYGDTTTYSFDQFGRDIRSSGPAGTIEKVYDTTDRLVTLKRNGQVLATSITYDGAGNMTGVTYPSGTGNVGNGTTGVFGFDALGRPATVMWTGSSGALITSDQVRRDADGRVVDQVIDGADHHSGDDYRYDSAGRLVEAWEPGAHYEYGFFENGYCPPATSSYKNGNRTTVQVTPTGGTMAMTAYCYDYADRLTASTDPAAGTISYDAHGNTTGLYGQTISYDAADRHMASTKDTTTVTYVRDAQDRIVERRVNGALTGRLGYTGSSDAPAFVTDGANSVLEVMLSLPGGVLLTTRGSGNVWSYPDIHGDLVAQASQAGAKQGPTTVYDPFGNVVSGAPVDNAAGSFDFGWLGQYQRPLESQTGFQPDIEMGARQYSPVLGRFLETDPVQGGSCNAYDYACHDSVNSMDLDGRRVYQVYVRYGYIGITLYLTRNFTHLLKVALTSRVIIAETGALLICAFSPYAIGCAVVGLAQWLITVWILNADYKHACATYKISMGPRSPVAPGSSNGKNCYTTGTHHAWKRARHD